MTIYIRQRQIILDPFLHLRFLHVFLLRSYAEHRTCLFPGMEPNNIRKIRNLITLPKTIWAEAVFNASYSLWTAASVKNLEAISKLIF